MIFLSCRVGSHCHCCRPAVPCSCFREEWALNGTSTEHTKARAGHKSFRERGTPSANTTSTPIFFSDLCFDPALLCFSKTRLQVSISKSHFSKLQNNLLPVTTASSHKDQALVVTIQLLSSASPVKCEVCQWQRQISSHQSLRKVTILFETFSLKSRTSDTISAASNPLDVKLHRFIE